MKDVLVWSISPAFGVNYICIFAPRKSCSLSTTKGQRASEGEFPSWGTPLKQNTGSRSGIIFQEHLSANGACGEMWSDKEMPPPPFLCTEGLLVTLHKQLNVTSLHPQIKERTGGGADCWPPHQPSQGGLSGLEWETSGTIYQVLLKLPQEESAVGCLPTCCLAKRLMVELLHKISLIQIKLKHAIRNVNVGFSNLISLSIQNIFPLLTLTTDGFQVKG